MSLKEKNQLDVPVRELGKEIDITKDTANRIVNKVNSFYFKNKDLFTSIYSKIA